MSVIELAEVHIGDVGTLFRLTFTDDGTAINISGATTKEIIFKKPDGTTITKDGNYSTDGLDGKLWCQLDEGEIDQAGVWRIQGHIKTAQGEWHSSAPEFRVHENLA